ncbi:MAG: hypothetical protein KatS3mg090_0445 [Patescibacteria group bacterium]|nr:MAG: hypothetical protein KatS3mg090_0445 [Patescibacteria group bacterium]
MKLLKICIKKWIESTDVDYPDQDHFKHPDDALADHLALGFVFNLGFDFGTDWFDLFWNKKNERRWKEFIRFIGTILQNEKNYPHFPSNLQK